MTFLVDCYGRIEHTELDRRFEAYQAYLESIKNTLPPSTRAFATAHWHYDFTDPRCPHDAWVENVTLRELACGDRRQYRSLQLELRLLGAYHDGWLDLIYRGVGAYQLRQPYRVPVGPGDRIGHGDWLIDELALSEAKLVVHEILFSSGARWSIECTDIEVAWTPFEADAVATSAESQG